MHKIFKYPKLKSLRLKLLMLIAIAIIGFLVFFLQHPKDIDIVVQPLKLDDNVTINFPYTDDNKGENIIIKTDKKDYYGVNSSDVYISITNTKGVDEKAVLLFYFPKPEEGVKDEKLIPRVDTLEQYGDSKWKFITFFKENIKINLKLLSIGLKKRESIPQAVAINTGAEINIPANQTIYFKSKIKYPEGSQGEFWIETIGTQGGYGLLDPTYYGTTASSDTKPGWRDAFTYRKKITVPYTKVSGGSDLSNFPVLINHTDLDLRTTANGGKAASGSGEFIITSSDGTTSLPYEIESYSATTGQFIGWVNVTTLSATIDTILYMYYGGAAAGGATNQNKTGTWNSDYKGVWHLPNGTTLTAGDSTSNNNTGTISGPTAGSGKMGGGGNFTTSTSDNISLGLSNIGGSTTNTVTLSAWIKANSLSAFRAILNSRGNSFQGLLINNNANALTYSWENSTDEYNAATGLTVAADNTWHLATVVITSTAATVYLDTSTWVNTKTHNAKTINLTWLVGRDTEGTDRTWARTLDEVRISNISRTTGWIVTEYNNQNSPRTFYTIGGQENKNPSTINYGTTASSDTKPGWRDAFTYRKKITIPYNKVSGGSNLSNFPVLINHTDLDIRTTANGGKAASGSGEFIITSSDGTTSLPYEIESYSATTGQFIGWVNVTTLSATIDTILYMYYGGAAAGGATNQNKTGTWNSDYKGVWHLPNGTTLTAGDSTSNANNGTVNGPVAVTGKVINGAGSFDGSNDYISVADAASLDFTTAATYSAWVYYTAARNTGNTFILARYDGSGVYFDFYDGGTADQLQWNVAGTEHNVSGGFASSPNTWIYVTGVYNGSTVQLYKNGNRVYSASEVDSQADLSLALGIGANSAGSNFFWPGRLDELRISNSAANGTAGWIATEYNNQNSPRTFYTIGGQENKSPSNPGIQIK